MSEVPLVTVLIPARNEEADIGCCLQAVLNQDHPHDRMEIVLVDGGSTDGTKAVAEKILSDGDVDWRIVDNPTGTTPSNLNAGLTVAEGDYVCRVDARSLVPQHYVRRCSSLLEGRAEVAVTGGAQVAMPRDHSSRAAGIARALNNRWATGGSRYRAGAASGPSDTVYLGAFRTGELRSEGGWDEFYLTNQDFELNRRMSRHGEVWFDSDLCVGYRPRRKVTELWQQYHRFGRWKMRYWRRSDDRPQSRQVVLLVGSATVVGLASWLVALPGRRTRRVVLGAGAGLVVLAAVDEFGGPPQDETLSVRFHAMSALVAVSCGWFGGVVREWVRETG